MLGSFVVTRWRMAKRLISPIVMYPVRILQNVQILADLGITNQIDDFHPNNAVTRGQIATFFYKTMEIQDS